MFFRDQEMTDEQHRDFAAQFGELEPFVLAPAANADVPEMHKLTFADGAAARGSRTDSWHTDGPFMECPPMGTVLRAVELPEYGGDTCWVSMYDVFESLSPAMQEMLEGLTAEHDFMKVTYTTFDDMPDPEAEMRKMRERYPVTEHPVVRTHPVTKRKLLYVNCNYTTRLVGVTEDENDILLPFLFDRVKDPAYQVRFHVGAGLGRVLGQPRHAALRGARLPGPPAHAPHRHRGRQAVLSHGHADDPLRHRHHAAPLRRLPALVARSRGLGLRHAHHRRLAVVVGRVLLVDDVRGRAHHAPRPRDHGVEPDDASRRRRGVGFRVGAADRAGSLPPRSRVG